MVEVLAINEVSQQTVQHLRILPSASRPLATYRTQSKQFHMPTPQAVRGSNYTLTNTSLGFCMYESAISHTNPFKSIYISHLVLPV